MKYNSVIFFTFATPPPPSFGPTSFRPHFLSPFGLNFCPPSASTSVLLRSQLLSPFGPKICRPPASTSVLLWPQLLSSSALTSVPLRPQLLFLLRTKCFSIRAYSTCYQVHTVTPHLALPHATVLFNPSPLLYFRTLHCSGEAYGSLKYFTKRFFTKQRTKIKMRGTYYFNPSVLTFLFSVQAQRT